MNFYKISEIETKKGVFTVYPDFRIGVPSNLMIRGKAFYAIWDESTGLWSIDEAKVQEIIDRDISKYIAEQKASRDGVFVPKFMSNFSSGVWKVYKQYISSMPDNARQLDESLTFSNSQTKLEDYRSKRLPYSFEPGECKAWSVLMDRLYSKEEREKIEWAIGAIVSGDSKSIQKFMVFYGDPGSGKGTVLGIIEKLFEGYTTVFDARSLGNSANTFAMEAFKSNPLVAIQQDGDLSRIEDNTRLNSIISHERMQMNEKFKSAYPIKLNSFLFIGTNKPVKITDAKSGIIRRLIDVTPTGRTFAPSEYNKLMSDIQFELGQIAWHCYGVYKDLGKHYYDGYKPIGMMFKTDVFFNFVEDSFDVFDKQDGISLTQAYNMYKVYCEEGAVEYVLPKYRFREELKNYFREYEESSVVDGRAVRSYYKGFLFEKFVRSGGDKKGRCLQEECDGIYISSSISEMWEGNDFQGINEIIDTFSGRFADCPAQYANEAGTPSVKWENCKTTLKDLDPTKLHYVKLPLNHIVIDFDLKDANGEKNKELNLEAASKWPETYAEWSKSGSGVHLHYNYVGDPTELSPIYEEGIEVKVFTGNSSLRRRFTFCNGKEIATISSGLPKKSKKGSGDMVDQKAIQDEKHLRSLIVKNLRKEIHPGTKPSVDFIKKILDDAYESGMPYDITDMRNDILVFANNSTNHSDYCVKLVGQMRFKSESKSDNAVPDEEKPMVFFDIECFPNLFIINWKVYHKDGITHMINPKPDEVAELFKMKLVGFNNRKYDNHMIYAASLGYSNEKLYELSQKIINQGCGFFGAAYNLSYTDVYDFASAANKMGLKKWEIKLGIHHQELGLPWDQPVPEERWAEVADYCDNDVRSTEAVFDALKGDWTARQILAELSGLTVNDTTNTHSAKIIFGDDKNPQKEFFYTDLSTVFPGYEFKNGVSTYMGDEIGEGGWVYAEPGIYYNVGLFDIASMHPSSIEALNLFGFRYTKRFSDIKMGRISIKHNDRDALANILDGKLLPFLERDDVSSKDLSNALKTVINSVYGLTSAKFDNQFRDPRNVDNIVAKRGALYMRTLQQKVMVTHSMRVAHIKTDSIKIPEYNQRIREIIMEDGKKYGYTFEHEATYDRMCLINNADYIAKYSGDPLSDKKDLAGQWVAVGKRFSHPYVFKTLFTKEEVLFSDLIETFSVKEGAIYMDKNNDPDVMDLQFVGRTGAFVPVTDKGCTLYRVKDGKCYAVSGTKGYRWLEAETVKNLGLEDLIDMSYYQKVADEAAAEIEKYGSLDEFVNSESRPMSCECHEQTCEGCPHFMKHSAMGEQLSCDLGLTNYPF